MRTDIACTRKIGAEHGRNGGQWGEYTKAKSCDAMLSLSCLAVFHLTFFASAGVGALGHVKTFRVAARTQVVMVCLFVMAGRALVAAYPRVDLGLCRL